MITEILKRFLIEGDDVMVQTFGSGLINYTWLVENNSKKYILQKINKKVFTNPSAIDHNLMLLANYLSQHYPGYLFTKPVSSIYNNGLVEFDNDSCYRLFNFVEGSHSFTVVEDRELAYEAAKQFGKFTRLLAGVDITKLKTTLPDFHNLSLRYTQFENAVSTASAERKRKASEHIHTLVNYKEIVTEYERILKDPSFKKRVTHHDTKISNVLFNGSNKGLCVIDLDTVMPGYFISDVGDMMRTYLSPAGEEETDFSKVEVREDYFEAIVNGYLSEMYDELTNTEKTSFIYAGKFMIYMQALRFMTDYLNNDIYYNARYELHNLNRTINQLTLLNKLVEKETRLREIVANALLIKLNY
jgi:Ser/Thr protein kinase RdoA (MazF antagonist)